MRRFLADLHIHTVLSPCAEREMLPALIVREALRKGLDVIAICDHNAAGNVGAVAAAAVTAAAAGASPGLMVVPGMEITTAEEVHVVGLFPDTASAVGAAREVREGLPLWKALTAFGPEGALRRPAQDLVDAEGRPRGFEEKMLASASVFSLGRAVDLIREYGGLAVAAHVDRKAFSVPGQLGFFPPDIRFDALEISAAGAARGRVAQFEGEGPALISSSDSHFLSDMGASATALEMEALSFTELRMALAGAEGRRCGIA